MDAGTSIFILIAIVCGVIAVVFIMVGWILFPIRVIQRLDEILKILKQR